MPDSHATPDRAAKSPFQRVVDDLSGGCGCACHTGTGYRTSCEHCQPDSSPVRAATANPYNEAMFKDALRRQYELGREDGYKEAVKMIRRATDEINKAKRRG